MDREGLTIKGKLFHRMALEKVIKPGQDITPKQETHSLIVQAELKTSEFVGQIFTGYKHTDLL